MPDLRTPPAVQINARRIVATGTAIWALAFLVLLPFAGSLHRSGHLDWLWTALAGAVLGVAGWSIMLRHRSMGRTV